MSVLTFNKSVVGISTVLILMLCLVIIIAGVVGSAVIAAGPGQLQAAPLNPAFVECMQKRQDTLLKGILQDHNYGYMPPTVDLSRIEKVRASRN